MPNEQRPERPEDEEERSDSESGRPTGTGEDEAPSMLPEEILEEIPIRAGADGDITDREMALIVEMFERSLKRGFRRQQSYNYVALQTGRHPATIANLIRDLSPRTKVAEMKLKASAVRMVDRILDKAAPHELIDILSRPNMGVLAPIKQQTGQGGFILSVQTDSLGAININTGVVHHGIQGNPAEGQPHLTSTGAEIDRPDHPRLDAGSGGERPSRIGDADAPQIQPQVLDGQEEDGAGGHEPRLGQAGTAHHGRRARVQGLQGSDVRAQGPGVLKKRYHGKGGAIDRAIHLNDTHEAFDE